jgi:hypothetical protein
MHIEDELRGNDMAEKRIVLIDKHIVVQWHDGGQWVTCNKDRKPHNDATDLAVYPNTPANMRRAKDVAGQSPVVTASDTLYSGPVGVEWCISYDRWNSRYASQVEAIAALARIV